MKWRISILNVPSTLSVLSRLAPLTPQKHIDRKLILSTIHDNHSFPRRIARKMGLVRDLQPSSLPTIHFPVMAYSTDNIITRVDIPSGTVIDSTAIEEVVHENCEVIALDVHSTGMMVVLVCVRSAYAIVEYKVDPASRKMIGRRIDLPAECTYDQWS